MGPLQSLHTCADLDLGASPGDYIHAPSLAACLADYRIVGDAHQFYEPVLVRPLECTRNGAGEDFFFMPHLAAVLVAAEAQHILPSTCMSCRSCYSCC